MSKYLLRLLCVTSLFVAGTLARGAPPPAASSTPNPDAPLDGNYVLTLSTADKKGPDFSVLVATQLFSVFHLQSGVTFDARIVPQENGAFLLYYDLNQHDAVTKSTVLIRPGEPIQLLSSGDAVVNARLDRYAPGTPGPSPTPARSGPGIGFMH